MFTWFWLSRFNCLKLNFLERVDVNDYIMLIMIMIMFWC